MNKTNIRLMEIAEHLDAITEEMKANKVLVMEGTLLRFYAEEIKELAEEMKGLLGSTSQ